jgi:hypothetical protein
MRRVLSISFVAAGLITLLGGAPDAATYVIRPDGLGDFPTVQQGIDASSDGDSIELTAGIFTGDGNRNLDYRGKAIQLHSQQGDPTNCILDCEYRGRGVIFQTGESRDSVLEGVKIINGYAPESYGGAIYCGPGTAPTIRNCVVYGCGSRGGGALYARAASPSLFDCEFDGNHTPVDGHSFRGGALLFDNSAGEIGSCSITWSISDYGGAIACRGGSSVQIHNSLIQFNIGMSGGAIHCDASAIGIYGSTLHCNSGNDAQVVLANVAALVMDHSIIADGIAGSAVTCNDPASSPSIECSDIFRNSAGDWTGCIADQSESGFNLAVDPLFCDWENGDVTLRSDSPCAVENNSPCGQIGAFGVGCQAPPQGACCQPDGTCLQTAEDMCSGEFQGIGTTCDPNPCTTVPVEHTTWGKVKAGFR